MLEKTRKSRRMRATSTEGSFDCYVLVVTRQEGQVADKRLRVYHRSTRRERERGATCELKAVDETYRKYANELVQNRTNLRPRIFNTAVAAEVRTFNITWMAWPRGELSVVMRSPEPNHYGGVLYFLCRPKFRVPRYAFSVSDIQFKSILSLHMLA